MEHLRVKLRTLKQLIVQLPSDLPLLSSGRALFSLDPDDFEDIGLAGALNRCFEIHWGHRAHGITITERGDKLKTTTSILHDVLTSISPSEDIGIVELWMDALLMAVGSVSSVGCGLRCHPRSSHAHHNSFTY